MTQVYAERDGQRCILSAQGHPEQVQVECREEK